MRYLAAILLSFVVTPASAGTAVPYAHGAKLGWYKAAAPASHGFKYGWAPVSNVVTNPPTQAVTRGAAVAAGTSSATGAAVTGGFIGGVAMIVGYDWYRRLNCHDPLKLGGPGFDRPVLPTDNVFVNPKCPPGRGR